MPWSTLPMTVLQDLGNNLLVDTDQTRPEVWVILLTCAITTDGMPLPLRNIGYNNSRPTTSVRASIALGCVGLYLERYALVTLILSPKADSGLQSCSSFVSPSLQQSLLPYRYWGVRLYLNSRGLPSSNFLESVTDSKLPLTWLPRSL